MAGDSHPADSTTIEQGPTIGVLLIEIGSERYALPSGCVHEIVRHRPWTMVPGAPPTLPGIISQRGLILAVVDMRALLGLPETEPQRSARFVLVQHQEIDMALLVDRVLDLATLAEAAFQQPTAFDTPRSRFVRGIAEADGQPLGLLDLDAVLVALREGS